MQNSRNQNKPICLFDSGIGGLTVLKKLINKFPDESYIYLADLERVPFGDKTKSEIAIIASGIIEWLYKFDPKMIIVACNTSSAVLQEQGRINPAPTVPIHEMIKSCAKEISKSNHKKISVWATKLVIKNSAYKNKIQKDNPGITVEEIACPKLVPMIEGLNFTIEERNKIIHEYLNQTSKDSNALILGCTHYPLISEDLKKLTDLELIDPADALINDLEKCLPPCRDAVNCVPATMPNQRQISLYATAQKEKLERFARLYLRGNIKVNSVSLTMVSA